MKTINRARNIQIPPPPIPTTGGDLGEMWLAIFRWQLGEDNLGVVDDEDETLVAQDTLREKIKSLIAEGRYEEAKELIKALSRKESRRFTRLLENAKKMKSLEGHLRKRAKAKEQLQGLYREFNRASKKQRGKIEREILRLEKEVTGHEKEISQMKNYMDKR